MCEAPTGGGVVLFRPLHGRATHAQHDLEHAVVMRQLAGHAMQEGGA